MKKKEICKLGRIFGSKIIKDLEKQNPELYSSLEPKKNTKKKNKIINFYMFIIISLVISFTFNLEMAFGYCLGLISMILFFDIFKKVRK